MKKNKINNIFEYSIGFLAFVSISIQFGIFYFEYRGNNWLSSFGDFFGFSAAFLSALVIVLLIRELKEQRESRVNLEKSFDDNAETLKSVKEFFESQSDYQQHQVDFINKQNNHLNIEALRNKYNLHIENIVFAKNITNKRLVYNAVNIHFLVQDILIKRDVESEIFTPNSIYHLFNKESFKLEQLFLSILRLLDELQKDINIQVEGGIETLLKHGINELKFTEFEKAIMLTKIEYLIKINSLLNTEEKYIFLLYLAYFNRLNKSNYSKTKKLIFDDIRLLSRSKISQRPIENSNFNQKQNIEDAIEILKNKEFDSE